MKIYIGLAAYVLILVYLPLILIGLIFLLKKAKLRRIRFWAIPFYVILAYAIPLGDVTWHSWNMSMVCPKVGLHVYRTVVVDGFVPKQHVSKDILERYAYSFVETRPRKNKNETVFRIQRVEGEIIEVEGAQPRAEWEYISDPVDYPDKSLGVTVDREIIRNRKTGEVIAEYFVFSAWRGWLDSWIASVIDNSTGVCRNQPKLSEKFQDILIPLEH